VLESERLAIGNLTILRELGRGGMGVVYESVDPVLNRPVAVKVISPRPHGLDPDWEERQARLIKEAQSAALLAHPNIVTVYKAGIADQTAYIEMELVQGETLEDLLDSRELSPQEAISVLRDVAQALDYAHLKGVIHRDVKPGNIMLCAGGTAKLMDFGIAKLASELLSYSGELTGSPQFMAPEQIKGEVVTPRSDQYSLAAVAYRLLTGAHTFSADTIAQLTYRVLFELPVPANVINPKLDVAVHDVLKKALRKEGASRYESCQTLVANLETALFNPPAEPVPSSTQEVRIAAPQIAARYGSWFVRFPFVSGMLFMALIVLGIVVLWWRAVHWRP
jgi:serine/threonine-protein kinase